MNIGRKLRRQTGGASIAEYALLIGLLGTTALVAISQVGGTAGNGIEHAGQVIAENAGSKKGHPGQGNPGNGNPGNGNPGNGNPGNGDPGEGGSQPEPISTVTPDQSFDFDGYVGPGETVGTVKTEGEPPKGFELVSGGGGLQIDDSGRITIVDPGAFGPVEVTKPVTVRVIPVSGPAAEGVIEVKRSTPVDLANDATTKGRLIVGTPKKNDIGTGDTGDWFEFEMKTKGDLQVVVRGDAHSGAAMTWPMVTLRDAAGKSIVSRSDQSSSLGAVLENDLSAGKYYIQVTPTWRGTPGGYSIETQIVDDVGYMMSNASELSLGSVVESSLIYGDAGDMWKVEIPHKTHVRFMSDSRAGKVDSDYASIDIFNAGGKLLAGPTGVITTAYAGTIINDMEPGTYYVRVVNTGAKLQHDYHLSVTEHQDDHRSSIATDTELELTELNTGALNVRPKPQKGSAIMGDPGDWYRLEVDERTDIQVHIDMVSGDQFKFAVNLRSSTGALIESNNGDSRAGGDGGNRFIFLNVAPGTYYIDARKALSYTRAENEYLISARKIIDAPETMQMAGTYGLGSIRGVMDYGEDVDLYRFRIERTSLYRIRSHDLGAGKAFTYILDSTGKTILNSGQDTRTINLTAGQDYYVKIQKPSKGEYGFSLNFDAPTWLESFPEFVLEFERSELR